MEWGNFWSSHLPRTSYDIDLDTESSNANDMVIFVAILPYFSRLVMHQELSGNQLASTSLWVFLYRDLRR